MPKKGAPIRRTGAADSASGDSYRSWLLLVRSSDNLADQSDQARPGERSARYSGAQYVPVFKETSPQRSSQRGPAASRSGSRWVSDRFDLSGLLRQGTNPGRKVRASVNYSGLNGTRPNPSRRNKRGCLLGRKKNVRLVEARNSLSLNVSSSSTACGHGADASDRNAIRPGLKWELPSNDHESEQNHPGLRSPPRDGLFYWRRRGGRHSFWRTEAVAQGHGNVQRAVYERGGLDQPVSSGPVGRG